MKHKSLIRLIVIGILLFTCFLNVKADTPNLTLPKTVLNAPQMYVGDNIRISWKKVDNADGYRVYRRENRKWKLLDVTSRLFYIDKDVDIGQNCQYTVRAYAKANGKTVLGNYDAKGVMIKQTFDRKVQKIKSVKAVSSSTVQICWEPREKATGYVVFRKKPGESWKRIKVVRNNTFFADETCSSATTYCYTVRAYASYNGKNIYSRYQTSGIYATTSMLCPQVKAVPHDQKGIVVSWSGQDGISGYYVFRRTSRSGAWKRIKILNSSKNIYVDADVTGGNTYYYTVRAYMKKNPSIGIDQALFSSYDRDGASAIAPKDKWEALLAKYQKDATTNQLVFVKYKGGTLADVSMYKKNGTSWKCILECAGYVGQNGIDKQREGDRKTPTGTFNLTGAFGIKDNPGTKMSYLKVNQYHYWCADANYYNTLVDIRQKPHSCVGEHLIDYVPHYYYGMFTDYNKNNVYKKGSAIFLHCTGSAPYTGGCVAVSQANMIKIIRNAEDGAKICIYEA